MWMSPFAYGGPSMSQERGVARLTRCDLSVEVARGPAVEHAGLASGQVGLHREVRLREIKRVTRVGAHRFGCS